MHRAESDTAGEKIEIGGGVSFAVGINDSGSRFLVSMATDDADILHVLTPKQASRLAGMAADNSARRLYSRLGFQFYGVERRAQKQKGRYVDLEFLSLMVSPAEEPQEAVRRDGLSQY